jgi:hypothetical protein
MFFRFSLIQERDLKLSSIWSLKHNYFSIYRYITSSGWTLIGTYFLSYYCYVCLSVTLDHNSIYLFLHSDFHIFPRTTLFIITLFALLLVYGRISIFTHIWTSVTCYLPVIFHTRHVIPSFSPSHFLSSLNNPRKRSEAVYAITSLFIGTLQ